MYLIAMYDITLNEGGQRRLSKILKLFRQYLHHTQKSVFEGEISVAKFSELKYKTTQIIDKNADYVLFFTVPNNKNIIKECFGVDFDATANILD